MQTFQDLKVREKAHQFTLNIYSITKKFPNEEKFGLTSQLRRAAVSVPSNIVEGFKRRGIRDSLNFYTIAEASLEEVKYQLLLAKDLKYIAEDIYEKMNEQGNEIAKMLYAFKKAIQE